MYYFIISDTVWDTANYMKHRGKHLYPERIMPRQTVSQISYSGDKAACYYRNKALETFWLSNPVVPARNFDKEHSWVRFVLTNLTNKEKRIHN